MKSILVTLLLMVSFLVVKAGDESISYVKAGGKTYFCQQVRQGLFKAGVVMGDGNVLRIPFGKIEAYSCKGHLYERLPLMCKDAKPGCTALMEYVTSRNGLRLYKYCQYGECCDPATNNFSKAQASYLYSVFKDGKFYLVVDKQNAASVLPFFGIDVIE
ncbi:MAG TPA: hypothetical protein PK796_07985 [Bacteroidales bacterium]|jgi:hypothetical protein|nr:hypothetical protein [Bacteroidales bacterium]